jgi:hypothetical protein
MVVLLAALSLSVLAQADEGVLSPLTPVEVREAHGGVAMQLDAGAYEALRPLQNFTMRDFVIDERQVADLELERFDVLSEDGQLVIEGDGVRRSTPAPDLMQFRGTVKGAPESHVYLALSPYGCNGFIRLPGKTYIIAGNEAGVNYIYDGETIGEYTRVPPLCGGAIVDPNAAIDHAGATAAPATEAAECGVYTLAVETDWEYRSRLFGSDAAAQAYGLSLFGAIAEIYRSEINIPLQVGYLRIWSSDIDPYVANGTVNNRLNEFQGHWNSSMGAVTRSTAHMLTGLSSGSAGGIAYLSALCTGSAFGVSGYLSGSFPLPVQGNNWQNWDLVVTSHELGHNFGAPHTHDIGIDGCGLGDCSQASQGTIMSYCHTCSGGLSNISLTLHPRMINERILPYLQSGPCGSSVTPPWFTTQPSDVTKRVGQRARLISAVRGTTTRTYLWKREGQPVSDGTTPAGSVISGATTTSLTINNAQVADGGIYALEVRETCHVVNSSPAELVVLCTADIDGDREVGFGDFLAFFNAYDAGTSPADIDGEPGVDFGDFLAFFNAYDNQC